MRTTATEFNNISLGRIKMKLLLVPRRISSFYPVVLLFKKRQLLMLISILLFTVSNVVRADESEAEPP